MLRLKVLVSALLLLTPALLAQEVPAGTVMPVMLQTTLNAKKARIGQRIQAESCKTFLSRLRRELEQAPN